MTQESDTSSPVASPGHSARSPASPVKEPHDAQISNATSASAKETPLLCISPIATTKGAKRTRDHSLSDNETTTKIASTAAAPPPAKTAKMSYSIMSLLSNDTNATRKSSSDTSSCGKEGPLNSSVSSSTPSPPPTAHRHNRSSSPTPVSPVVASAAPFLLHPFLQMSNMAFLSNFGLAQSNTNNSKQQQLPQFSAEMWPWLNMAAMTSLYGAESE